VVTRIKADTSTKNHGDAVLLITFFFLQFLEFLFRNILKQVLLDIVLGRQLEAVFADEEIL